MMPGPMAKHPSTRQRRNKTSTNAILRIVPNQKVPPMPKGRRWRAESREWWKAIWTSPMRQEFVSADEQALHRMLLIQESIYEAFDAGDMRLFATLQAEMRQQEQRFGFTPMDRRKLQWQIEQAEQAEEKTSARRKKKTAESVPTLVEDDPRAMLA